MKKTRNFEDQHTIYDTGGNEVGRWAGNSAKNLQWAIEIASNLHYCCICTENIPHRKQIPKDLLLMTYRFDANECCTIWGCDKKGFCLIRWELRGGIDGEAIMHKDQAREFIRSLGILCGIEL